MEIPCSQESLDTLFKNFVEAVDSQYLRQYSTETLPEWSQIKPLVGLFVKFEYSTIAEQDQKIFIKALLKYVELVMGFVTSYENSEYRKQINYAATCLSFVPDIFKHVELRNLFVEEATVKIGDLVTNGEFNLVSKRSVLRMYNDIAEKSKKQLRIEVAKSIPYLMYELVDHLSTHGDYCIQSDIVETLFRVFGDQIRKCELNYSLLPGSDEFGNSEDLGKSLLTDITIQNFDGDVRKWLNKVNETSPLIFSIECKKIMFGSQVIAPPEGLTTTWVDFNQKESMLGFYTEGSSPASWNQLIVLARDVKKVEVTRQLKVGSEVTLSLQMSKSCISEERGMQSYYNKLEKHIILSLFSEEKDKIAKLIGTVLPQVFGDAFSHTRISSRIAAKPKRVYKPLAVKISRRKSRSSDVSIATSVSRSKSDATSVEVKQVSSAIPGRRVSSPVCSDHQTTAKGLHVSSVQRATSLNDISTGSIPTFTRQSCISDVSSDLVSITTAEKLNISVSSNATSAMMFDRGEPKVQDNVVTSSHGDDEISPKRIEILSGRCSGRSTDYSKLVQGTVDFHPSEVFSNSPVKISHQKNLQDISSLFSSDDEEERDKQWKNIQRPKMSTMVSQEDLLDEEFQTALEDIEHGYFERQKLLVQGKKVSCVRSCVEEQDILNESNNGRAETAAKIEDPRRNQEDKELAAADYNTGANEDAMDTGSSTSNIRMKVPQNVSNKIEKASSQVLVDNEEICIVLVENQEIFTKDNTEGYKKNTGLDNTEGKKNIIESEVGTQELNSQDIFNFPTQVVSSGKDQNTDQFADLSLAVNIGLSEKFSEVAALDKSSKEILQNKEEAPRKEGEKPITVEDNYKVKSIVVIKNSFAVKESTIIKTESEIKKKKPRTLIRKGTKRFELKDKEETGNMQNNLIINKRSIEPDQIKSASKEPETCASEKGSAALKTTIGLGVISNDNNDIPTTDGVLKNGGKVVSEEDTSNLPLNQPLELGGKELVIRLTQMDTGPENKNAKINEDTTSDSDSPLGLEINMENVDYIDKFNQLEKIEETRTKSSVSKFTKTIKPIEVRNPSYHFEEEIVTDIDNEVFKAVDAVHKFAEEEEDNSKLSGFILKKSGRPLLESQESNVEDDLKKDMNNIELKRIKPVISPEKKEIKGKVSKPVRKGKKGKRKQPKKEKRNLKDAGNKIDLEKSNKKETTAVLDVVKYAKSDIEIIPKDGSGKTNALADSQDKVIMDTLYTDLNNGGYGNEIQEDILVPLVTTDDNLEPFEEITTQNKMVPAKTPDTSPEVLPHGKTIVTCVAQIHHTAHGSTVSASDEEVKKSKRLAEKKQRSIESLSQECKKLEQTLSLSYKNVSDSRKRKHQNLDDITVASPPVLKKTQTHNILNRQSPYDLGEQVMSTILNKSRMNTTTKNRSRKLYNEGSYGYLDELPDIAEQQTPDLDETPIPLVKGTKLTKQKKGPSSKEKQKKVKKAVEAEPTKKTKKSPEDKTRPESSKPRTKPTPKRGKRKQFSFYAKTDFVSLDEMFNKTCRNLGYPAVGGFNSTHQPMDVVVRAPPQNSSSDESPVGFKNLRPNKNISPELSKYIGPKTPSTPDSFPDLEVEPCYKKAEASQKKINILHDIIIKPKRPSTEFIDGNRKRRKVDQEEIITTVQPLPNDNDDITVTNQNTKEITTNQVESALTDMLIIIKYLLEQRSHPDFVQKFNGVIDIIKRNYNI